MEFLLGFSCPAKPPKLCIVIFSKPLKSCPDFSSSYGKAPAFESIRPFTGGGRPSWDSVHVPFACLTSGNTTISLAHPKNLLFWWFAFHIISKQNENTDKRSTKTRRSPRSWGRKGPEIQTETQWFYCRRLQQQRREKTAQLAKEKRAKCLPKAKS